MIHNWSARRSGGRITIHGERHKPFGDGSVRRDHIKITGIDAIMLEGDRLIAIDRNEVEHELAAGWTS